MLSKRKLLLCMFYLPGVVCLLRLIFTLWTFVYNPLGLRLPYLQLIPLGVIGASCFGHFKLYRDSVPIVTLLVPTLLHAIIIFVFMKTLQIVPFLPMFIPDIGYMVLKSIKASMFPYYLEGEDDEDFSDLLMSDNKVG